MTDQVNVEFGDLSPSIGVATSLQPELRLTLMVDGKPRLMLYPLSKLELSALVAQGANTLLTQTKYSSE